MAHAMALPAPAFPAQWIAENVTGSPSAKQVASYIKLVEEAPLAAFLEHNPDADADKDGKLTTEERDAHLKAQMGRMHQKLLERHPEADLDGNGVLTHEEASEFFKSKARAGGFGSTQLAEPGAQEVHVEVIAEEPPK
jgi:hypothetical protein